MRLVCVTCTNTDAAQ